MEQELVLLGELMAAAAGATDHLEHSQIDEVLVQDPTSSEPAQGSQRPICGASGYILDAGSRRVGVVIGYDDLADFARRSPRADASAAGSPARVLRPRRAARQSGLNAGRVRCARPGGRTLG